MTKRRKIRIGIAKGNLNREEPNRGCTSLLLEKVGFKMIGYNPRAEKDMPTAEGEPDIEFYCMKPKQFPVLLEKRVIDLAIFGKDTLEERYSDAWMEHKINPEVKHQTEQEIQKKLINELSNNDLELELLKIEQRLSFLRHDMSWLRERKEHAEYIPKNIAPITSITNLGYGKIDICWGLPKVSKYGREFKSIKEFLDRIESKRRINIASAYPNITIGKLVEYIQRAEIILATNLQDANKIIGVTDKVEYLVAPCKFVVYPLTSSTEMMIRLGLANIVVDSVASGDNFRKNNLEIIGRPISSSTAHLYARSDLAEKYADYKTTKDNFTKRTEPNHFEGIPLKKLEEIFQRFEDASKEYALERTDSIYHPSNNQSNP